MSHAEGGAVLLPKGEARLSECEGAALALLSDAAGRPHDECSAQVWYRRREATLTYDRKKGRIFLQQADAKGRVAKTANFSMWNVMNIETPEEWALRQSRRTMSGPANTAVTSGKPHARRSFRGLLTTSPQFIETIHSHSRSFSVASSHHFGNESHSAIEASVAGLARSISSGVRSSDVSGRTYHLYYVKESASSPRVSTVKFAFLPDDKNREDLRVVVQAILHGLYPRGAKQLFLFVSPKSGTGNGVNITEEQVLPALYFTRHEVCAFITTRVFHCEDYIANITNEFNRERVIVCVGGDGMIHEAVNGLFRRKRALLEREEAAKATKTSNSCGWGEQHHKKDKDTKEADATGNSSLSLWEKNKKHERGEGVQMEGSNLPEPNGRQVVNEIPPNSGFSTGNKFSMLLIATIPSGSGCGMAKTLGVHSIKESILALVHLQTCTKDLMSMQYLVKQGHERHPNFFPHTFVKTADKRETSDHLQEEKKETTTAERIAFMSMTFGLLNDIDRGSEKLRWMGNHRFTVYGAYTFLRGVRSYRVRMRYLPWLGRKGERMEKLEDSGSIPGEVGIPHCTRTDACSHCQAHRDPTTTPGSSQELGQFTFTSQDTMDSDSSSMLQREVVDFDDNSLPWVTLDGSHYAIFLSNIRDAAKDIVMTPLAHMSDGAIDIVFAREKDSKCGRLHFLKFFTDMESGKHVYLPFVSYVKARAVELEAVEGFIMSDGESMPFTKVRVIPMRRAAEFVRGQ
ncbi:putative sphingosine kinase A, B [Trypanosoma rangeli]|uniref:Putative sphingosine kinase A, B n=1 Tax=Trypanosoma rangeli TaxID=5698 RepID=A0A422NN92_TRYRA|nr:putative sphingosine kinase A, B [Trypanosoma rangeli]RNF06874.1 putative sphingosine kinase A, B [Trypanosoma rangeli]|eukprot:RNF06874.1 putative sphingosine kinase A, B [Trypanosoma rangeli]